MKKKKVADLPRYPAIFGYEKEFKKSMSDTVVTGVKAMIDQIKKLSDINIKSNRGSSKDS